jgi:hypothetical protein
MSTTGAKSGRIGGTGARRVLRCSGACGWAARDGVEVAPEVAAVHGIDRTHVRGQIYRVLLLIPRPQR